MLVTTFASKTTLPPQIPSPSPLPEPKNLHNPLQPFTRRDLLTSLSLTLLPFFTSPQINNHDNFDPFSVQVSQARGLFQMPPFRLSNRYFLVRAGESEYESLGIINTNPVAKTSVDSGLSKEGKKQTAKAALALKAMGACEANCWIWPSITQRAYQAAEIIAAVNGISRSHIVPEYSFLDARGLGAYEGKNLDSISELMSILETQYSEDTVIIVSPDSDNLTILQAGLVGLDLRRHRDLSFGPGEVRFVDTSSIPTYKQPASAVYKCVNPPNCS
ncbi:uncharacterized protein [Coffea arabica]|uniref:Uncharacterized protein isoform X3 n=1 Tax=Coffea arabica TaxID=13443 RepID=A0A6P6X2P7_COFAR|nr:uncharacterized protein LOC113738775 isoform X2 [Coffea arabica]